MKTEIVGGAWRLLRTYESHKDKISPEDYVTKASNILRGMLEEHCDVKFETVDKGFEKQLEELLNMNSIENASNTPDFVLARYLVDCLEAYNRAVNHREELKE